MRALMHARQAQDNPDDPIAGDVWLHMQVDDHRRRRYSSIFDIGNVQDLKERQKNLSEVAEA